MKPLAITAILVAAFAAQRANGADAAKLFNDSCTACHTIGGGDGAGPDLIRAAKLPRDDIRKAVVRMQDNVGPLKPDQIDALADFLRSKAPATVASVAIPPEQKAASAAVGRQLFYGGKPFANGGTPCFACHTVGGRGGNLAVDLTAAYQRRGEAALVATAQQPGIPLMKAAYAKHAITAQEAWHLAAFFRDAEKTEGPKERPGVLHATAFGVALAVLATMGAAFRPRRRR